MRFVDILRIAISTFVNNKMRTLLTVFGISIGIGAIVFLVSLGYGLQQITIGEIQSIKALKTLNVTSGDSQILSMGDDAVEKLKTIPNVVTVYPTLSMSGQVSYGTTRTDVLINAASAESVDLEAPRFEAGGLYRPGETDKIIITAVAAKAFNVVSSDLVGKKVKVIAYIPDPKDPKKPIPMEKEFTVAGVIKDNTASYMYLPISVVSIPTNSQYSTIKVNTAETDQIAGTKSAITALGYRTSSIGEKVNQMNQVFRIVQIVLLSLGAIALVVASIGMFNTLTISLLERTKDIGVMKAIGATDKEVYRIFLSEATIISFTGGAMGILSAFILGAALNIAVSALAVKAGGEKLAPFQAPMEFIGVIFAFSIIVGVLTGFYPARRAAKLNPLDALRYE